MISTLASILQNTTRTVQNWKKEERPIMALLEQYFTKEELLEFLDTGKIQKQEIVKKFSEDELNHKLLKTDASDNKLFLDHLAYNIDVKKPGIFNSNIPAYFTFFKSINESIGANLTPYNAKQMVIEYIQDKPTKIMAILSSDTLNHINKKQLLKDLNQYYSSAEIYILITKNIELKKNK